MGLVINDIQNIHGDPNASVNIFQISLGSTTKQVQPNMVRNEGPKYKTRVQEMILIHY